MLFFSAEMKTDGDKLNDGPPVLRTAAIVILVAELCFPRQSVTVNGQNSMDDSGKSKEARHPQLLYESKVYKILQGGDGIPHIRYYGNERDYHSLVVDLLGPSLEDLFNFCCRRFTMKETGRSEPLDAFVFNADEYIFTDRMIPIPRPLMPNRPVTLCTDIRCLHPEKQLVEEEVQMLLCREERARPVWTANFQMPLSELEII
uniref:Uncharacterized protein n=1 Tax=Globodera rostochiensis TaxID=31243 RepID=A0A914HP65_GLORO